MFGPMLAVLLFALSPTGGEAERGLAFAATETCGWSRSDASAAAVHTLRRLVRHRCHEQALAFAAAVVPTRPWAERLDALGVVAEVPAGERRLGAERLALAEAILGRLGEPPAGDDPPRRAALSTEALLTVVCLQDEAPPPGTLAGLLRRFVAAQRPDEALATDLLAMRRIYLRWRYRTDCAAEQAEALAVLETFRDL